MVLGVHEPRSLGAYGTRLNLANVHMVVPTTVDIYEEPEAADVLAGSVTVVGDEASRSAAGAICLLGLFSSSNVTPSSLVIPTTAGSPFFTNSHWPDCS